MSTGGIRAQPLSTPGAAVVITVLAVGGGGTGLIRAAAYAAAVLAAALAVKAVPAGVFGVPAALFRKEDFALDAGNGNECHGAPHFQAGRPSGLLSTHPAYRTKGFFRSRFQAKFLGMHGSNRFAENPGREDKPRSRFGKRPAAGGRGKRMGATCDGTAVEGRNPPYGARDFLGLLGEDPYAVVIILHAAADVVKGMVQNLDALLPSRLHHMGVLVKRNIKMLGRKGF